MRLKNKVSIITGAARGIGKATAISFGEEGAVVIVTDIDIHGANRTVKEMCERGLNAFPLRLDISDVKNIQYTVKNILDKYGYIHILVNNAGVFSKTPILDMNEKEWDRVININLKGTFFLSKEVLPVMIKQGYGRIINVSSLSAKRGGVTSGINYGASKVGLFSVTKYMAKFGAKYGVNVNAVVPGFVDTDMFRSNPKDKISEVIKSIPLGRLAYSEDIAKAIIFLSSDDANYITGEILDINGGVFMD